MKSDRMNERQAIESQPSSRWDALGPSSSSAARRRPRGTTATNKGKSSNPSIGGQHRSQGKGNHNSAGPSLRPGHVVVGNSWRRRAAANDVRNNIIPTNKTMVEEEKVRAALKKLQISVTSLLDEKNNVVAEKSIDGTQACFVHSLGQLVSSLFVVSDPKKFLENPRLHELNSTTTRPDISNDLFWEAGCSLLRHMRVLSQSNKNERCQFMLSISSVALPSLQSLIQHLHKDQSTRTKAMTDLRLCEFAQVLLDIIGCEVCTSFDGDSISTDEFLCKSNLFSCLAKILAISTMGCHPSLSKSKNSRGKRGALFPWGAEKTVNLIVKQTALPFIELLATGDDTAMPISMKLKHCHGAMECLYLLLRDPNWDSPFEVLDLKLTTSNPHLSKHAAAILSPLVVDVLPDGKENQRANPLRSRTLSAIHVFWEWSCEYVQNGTQSSTESTDRIINIVTPCRCMAAALHAVRVVGKGKAQNNQNADASNIKVSSVARQLWSMIQNGELQSFQGNFLNLLTLLCLAFPSASAGQWHLFLEQSGTKVSPLLSILEEGASAIGSERYDDKSLVVLPSALRATSTLLTAMPFTLWISREARPTMRITGGDFSTRVRNALLTVLNCTLNLMAAIKSRISCEWLSNQMKISYAQSMEHVMMQVSQVAEKLCTILPFDGENSILLQPASNIVQCAGDIYVHSVKIITSKPLITEPELECTLLYKSILNFSKFITQSLGVDSFDTVKVTTCSAPAENWLSNASSYAFIGLLLTDSCWTFPSSKDRIEMLSSVARRSPWTLAREPFNLASFCELCVVQCKRLSDDDSRLLGLKLIESFILGRKSFLADSISNKMVFSVVPETLYPLLRVALHDHVAAVRACAVSSLGPFLKHDWVGLFLSDSDSSKEQCSIDWTPLEQILNMCIVHNEKNAHVRSSSCKVIGDICTACIWGGLRQEGNDTHETLLFSDGFILSLICKISEVMIHVLTDENASVRSMALHAIGNMAFALKEHCDGRFALQFSAMKQLFPSVCALLGDKDEKVVANAIRSISHIAYFVYYPEYLSEIEDKSSATLDVYRSLLSDLSAKIKFALEDAAGEIPMGLTWKQRNGAKKHAWGSCTTLGKLLSFSNILPYIDITLTESSLSSLFRCIQLSNIINEKIVAAAIKALVNLPITMWHHLSCKCDSVGRGLATCFDFLYEKKTTASNHDDVESLAHLLLISARRADFCNLFLIQDSVPFSVEYFYQWLVRHDTEPGVLKEIAAAVTSQKVEHILDVSVVQMFLSRTIQQNRRQSSPCKLNVAALSIDEYDEEGDEL